MVYRKAIRRTGYRRRRVNYRKRRVFKKKGAIMGRMNRAYGKRNRKLVGRHNKMTKSIGFGEIHAHTFRSVYWKVGKTQNTWMYIGFRNHPGDSDLAANAQETASDYRAISTIYGEELCPAMKIKLKFNPVGAAVDVAIPSGTTYFIIPWKTTLAMPAQNDFANTVLKYPHFKISVAAMRFGPTAPTIKTFYMKLKDYHPHWSTKDNASWIPTNVLGGNNQYMALNIWAINEQGIANQETYYDIEVEVTHYSMFRSKNLYDRAPLIVN